MALTQRFLDSADGVLWLSSSTSPGQVQELDELARELRRSKPLLPVVTRSDFIEEDEVDGAIVKCLRNKTGPNRALQEADVYERAKEKLLSLGVAPQLLSAPLSVSVHVARAQGKRMQPWPTQALSGSMVRCWTSPGPRLPTNSASRLRCCCTIYRSMCWAN
ncbi:hypothetical protein WJ968_31750 [Achromobacter xylosoxidans]